jgi:hypothetical protein
MPDHGFLSFNPNVSKNNLQTTHRIEKNNVMFATANTFEFGKTSSYFNRFSPNITIKPEQTNVRTNPP